MKFLKFFGSGEAKKKKLVAFSFDDGPNPKNIIEVLTILNTAKVSGTFFWIVENARKLKEAQPKLFKKVLELIYKGNHEIGLHAPYDYKPSLLTRAYGKFTKQELKDAKGELEKITNLKIKLYRPHILLQPATIFFANQIGLTTVIGDLYHYADAAASRERQINKFSKAPAGSILIFHDGLSKLRQSTSITKVLPKVILNLQDKDLVLTKISSLL